MENNQSESVNQQANNYQHIYPSVIQYSTNMQPTLNLNNHGDTGNPLIQNSSSNGNGICFCDKTYIEMDPEDMDYMNFSKQRGDKPKKLWAKIKLDDVLNKNLISEIPPKEPNSAPEKNEEKGKHLEFSLSFKDYYLQILKPVTLMISGIVLKNFITHEVYYNTRFNHKAIEKITCKSIFWFSLVNLAIIFGINLISSKKNYNYIKPYCGFKLIPLSIFNVLFLY